MNKIAVILTLAVVVVISGCISSPEKGSANRSVAEKLPGKITTLRIGYQPTTHHIAEMVAAEKGWWLKNLEPFGIKEIMEFGFPSGNSEIKAMREGDLDVAYVGISPLIAPVSQGMDARIVAGVNINGSNLVLLPNMTFKGPQSLRGLSIGTFPQGTVQNVLLKKWLIENGMNVSDVKIIPMGPGDAVTAISNEKVAGVFLPHPAPAIIETTGKGKSVLGSGEIWPGHACCCLTVSGRLIRDNPDLLEQIVKTHIKAMNYVKSHPDEVARIYSNHTGQDLKMVEYSIKTWDGNWTSNPYQLINSTLENALFQFETNFTQKVPSEKELFDTSFYDKAL